MHWPFSKMRRIRCPDGSERTVFKNPDDAFPLLAKDWSASVKATTETLKELQVSLALELQQSIAGLLVQIDEANRTMQLNFRAVYVVYLIDPCRQLAWLKRRVKEIIENESVLRRTRMEIAKIKCLMDLGYDKQVLAQAVAEALTRLAKSDLEEEISGEIQKVKKNTSAWMEETR